MTKKTFLLSAKEPKVEVNFSQSLKVTMKILHKHLKWNIRTSDQKSYPNPKPSSHPTSNLLKSPSCSCFLARILSNAWLYFCTWPGVLQLDWHPISVSHLWLLLILKLGNSVPLFTKHPLETLCLKLHCVQYKAQRPCSTSLYYSRFSRYLWREWKASSLP